VTRSGTNPISPGSPSADTPPSIITQPASQIVTAGRRATFSVVASGTAPLSYQWRKNGTAVNGATSSSYMTPAEGSSDNSAQFTVTVSNSAATETSGAAILTIVVAAPGPAPLRIATGSLPNAEEGVQFEASLSAIGGLLPYHWEVASGSLPSGLSINAASGILSGTPTQKGQFDFSVEASDSSSPNSQTAIKVVSLSVLASALQVATSSVPNGQDNNLYQKALVAAGGIGPYTWSISGALPAGVSMSATGVIAGIPTQAGQFQFTATVKDSSSPPQSASMPFTFQFSAAATPIGTLTVATSDLHTGLIQQPYLAILTTVGGTGSNDWSVASGSLPIGLQLSSSRGEIAGTPTQGGSFSFTITAADGGGATTSKNFSLQIFEQPLDEYGGFLNKTSSAGGNGYFRFEKTASNRWLFVDPLGNYFFPIFVEDMDVYDGGDTYRNALATKYTGGTWSSNTWTLFTQQMVRRARSWGFNAIGVGASNYTLPIVSYASDGPNSEKMPFVDMIKPALYGVRDGGVQDLIFGSDPTIYNGWRDASFPDVYSPLFSQAIQAQITGKEHIYGMALDQTPWLIAEGMDDLDNLLGWRSSKSVHTGWLTAVTSPVETLTIWPQNNSLRSLHADNQVYTKAQWANFLQDKYGSVSGLNATWGSNYTTFGTAGAQIIGEILGDADGSTRSFSKILTHTVVDPHSLAVYVAAVIATGDDGSGSLYDNAVISNESRLGSINYSDGSLAVTFSTAPAAGAVITVNYIYGGWPRRIAGGTGLLDEDGSSPWIGKDFVALSDTNPTVKADMDAFLQQQLDTYFSQMSSAIHTWLPHHLILGPAGLSPMARPIVFQEAGKYIDYLDVAADDFSVQPAGGLSQALLNAYSYLQKPIEAGTTITSQKDSRWANFPRPSDDYPDQEARGQAYATELGTVVNLKDADSVYFVVDFDIFAWTDKASESANFGLASNLDNAYDGVEDQTTIGYDSWGFKTGGEAGNYGDFITPVSQANFDALRAILQQ